MGKTVAVRDELIRLQDRYKQMLSKLHDYAGKRRRKLEAYARAEPTLAEIHRIERNIVVLVGKLHVCKDRIDVIERTRAVNRSSKKECPDV